jgi:TPR repeat protein
VKLPSSLPPSKSTQNPDSDVRITDRLATQHNHGQDSKPKSSELANRAVDHNVALSGNERSASSLPPPKPTQNPDVDARLAERGDAFAQYRLGRYYAQRDGRQTPESVSWYKKAASGLHRLAESGNGQAMYVLGVMYAYGRGVPRDTEQARRWLTQAVEQKVTAAQPVLMKLNGTHTTDPKPEVGDQPKNAKKQN